MYMRTVSKTAFVSTVVVVGALGLLFVLQNVASAAIDAPRYATEKDFLDQMPALGVPQRIPPKPPITSLVDYNDVLVIINDNSALSGQVGNYFVTARNVPAVNVVHVNVTTTEEITPAEFGALRAQIESYILNNNLEPVLNYLVTTKGVPLKIRPEGDSCFSTNSACASVESELSLILSSYQNYIGQPGRILSPYYYTPTSSFSRAQFGIYLVTRLDGYTFNDIRAMIDKSAPKPVIVPSSATFVFDQDPDWNGSIPSLNSNMVVAKNLLTAKGNAVELDTSIVYLTRRNNVIGYVSWGSNDHYANAHTTNAIPHHTWLPGAIAETYVSTDGRTFNWPPVYGQSLIADLIAEGATGAKGYVYEPFSSAMAYVPILFDRYTSNYNLAESYSMASRYLSWMDVVVGDPKTTILISESLPIELAYFRASVVPGAGNNVKVDWGTLTETNNYGFYIQRRTGTAGAFADLPASFTPGNGTTLIPHDYSWTDQNVSVGTYFYRLRQIDLDGTVSYPAEPARVVITAPRPPAPARVVIPAPRPPACTDFDGGITDTVQGRVTYGSRTYVDQCGGAKLIEYYCNNDRIAARYVTCKNGCVSGACKQTDAQNFLSVFFANLSDTLFGLFTR
ncbi:MAG: TIGR03790 family protein [Patescibacteria group bacterium]